MMAMIYIILLRLYWKMFACYSFKKFKIPGNTLEQSMNAVDIWTN